jgi:hypothetical protein
VTVTLTGDEIRDAVLEYLDRRGLKGVEVKWSTETVRGAPDPISGVRASYQMLFIKVELDKKQPVKPPQEGPYR